MTSIKHFAVLSLVLATSISQAGTIAAQSLKCGGLITVERMSQTTELHIRRVGASTCEFVEVDALNIRERISGDLTRIQLRERDLGSHLTAIIDKKEVVILKLESDTKSTQNSEGSVNGSLVEIERQRLAIEQQRLDHQRSVENTKTAIVVGTVGAAAGAAVIEGVGSTER